jgi:hypothetical protein
VFAYMQRRNCTLDMKNGTAYLTSKIWNTLVASSCGTCGEVTMMEHIYSYESLLLAIWKLHSCFFVQSFD